jgi:Na+-driven multidrug efflux pump
MSLKISVKNYDYFSTTLEYGRNVVRIGAALHLLDGTSSFNSAILRTVGAQFYASVSIFIGFYLVGSPIGLPLMFKTGLKIYGFCFRFQSKHSIEFLFLFLHKYFKVLRSD